jgi:hypothetical protein
MHEARSFWWKTTLALVAATAGVGAPSSARGEARDAKTPAKATLPSDLARVPADAAGFVSLRPADVWFSDLGKNLRKRLGKDLEPMTREFKRTLGLTLADIERVTLVLGAESPDPMMAVMRTRKPYDRKAVLAAFAPDASEEKFKGYSLYAASRGQALLAVGDKVFVVGPVEVVKDSLAPPRGKGEGLAPALATAAGKHALVAAFNPTALPEERKKKLPPEAKPFAPLLQARLAVLTLDVAETSRADLRVCFASEDDARAGEKALTAAVKLGSGQLENLVKVLAKDKDARELVALLRKVETDLKAAPLRRTREEVAAALTVKIDKAALGSVAAAVAARVRAAATRQRSANNLRQLAIAMHNYADSNRSVFPPAAVYDKDGKALLSWRVLILPYIEQEKLFKKFRLDEAWDGPNNKKLLASMPKVYAPPVAGKAKANETFYQAFVGPGAGFEGKRGLRMPADYPDGTSNTIMFVEAAKAVPWSKPDDLPYDPKKPLPKVGGIFGGGFHAAFFDGSVRFYRKVPQELTLRILIGRNDGQVVPADGFE